MRRLLPYAQLVRLPNVFTALADIGLGAFAAWAAAGAPLPWVPLILLLLASACLYSAGMVWNDFFDLEQDRRERPFRPLPSGRVTPGQAALLGTGLLAAGVLLGTLAGRRAEGFEWQAPMTVLLLGAAILLYDAWLKRTWLGPVAMGSCRFLNVLLGLSLTDVTAWPWPVRLHVALTVGLYIVGVTWFARTEARRSSQTALALAAATMLAALVLALAVPVWFPPAQASPLFPYLLVGFGFLLALPVTEALRNPAPAQVQAAVKRAVLGLVVLDAVLATAVAGTFGLSLLLLLLPALYLGRWVYST